MSAKSQQLDDNIDNSLENTFDLVVLRAGIVVILVILTLFLLRRWINDPIERLAEEVRTVAEGDLDRPIEPSGPPELASLGADVEGMRRRLRNEGN